MKALQLVSLLACLVLASQFPLALGQSAASSTTVSTSSQATSVTLSPMANSYVVGETGPSGPGNIGTLNYGNSTVLDVGFQAFGNTSAVSLAYFGFSLTNGGSPILTSSVSSARLMAYARSVYASNSSAVPVVAYAVSNSTWSEYTINYVNAPSVLGSLSTASVSANSTYYSWDVTGAVNATESGGNVTLALGVTLVPNQEDHVLFNSREASANLPELVLTLARPAQAQASASPVYLGIIGAVVVVAVALLWYTSSSRQARSAKVEGPPS